MPAAWRGVGSARTGQEHADTTVATATPVPHLGFLPFGGLQPDCLATVGGLGRKQSAFDVLLGRSRLLPSLLLPSRRLHTPLPFLDTSPYLFYRQREIMVPSHTHTWVSVCTDWGH